MGISTGVGRYEGLGDASLNLINFASNKDLLYTLFETSTQFTSSLSLDEIITTISAGLDAKVEVQGELGAAGATVFLYGEKFMWTSDVFQEGTTYHWNRGGIAGASKVCNLISQRLMDLSEPHVTTKGHYNIIVHEFYTQLADNGTRQMTETKHVLNTKSNLLGLRHETYPYMNVMNLITSYLMGHENIFLLYGDPGVGKTCLMKILLRETAMITESGFHAIYVKDKEVLRRPEFWAQLSNMSRANAVLSPSDEDDEDVGLSIESGYNSCVYLILDDLDNELQPRTPEKDNFIVSQLLSFADGLFENHLKIIITSNQSLNDIDKAIIRPGRCFDVMHLRALTYAEASDVWVNALGMSLSDFQESFPDSNLSVTQASLVSEYTRIKDLKDTRNYLYDQSVSVRRQLLQSK